MKDFFHFEYFLAAFLIVSFPCVGSIGILSFIILLSFSSSMLLIVSLLGFQIFSYIFTIRMFVNSFLCLFFPFLLPGMISFFGTIHGGTSVLLNQSIYFLPSSSLSCSDIFFLSFVFSRASVIACFIVYVFLWHHIQCIWSSYSFSHLGHVGSFSFSLFL